ncbi:MAG: PAS domain S-box protein [Nitrospirae bacterium]|nr:MAG: PAS domain S-box protein [Nitrospirota bacterium]
MSADEIKSSENGKENTMEREELFSATFEQAAVGIAHMAPDGQWLRVNRKLCDIVGYSRDELIKLTFQDITFPADLETDLEYVRQMLADEIKTYSMEKRYIRKDKSIVWINLTVSLVRKHSGEPEYFISVVEDIMGHKQAEAALRETQRQLTLLIANLPGVVYRCRWKLGTHP